MKEYSWITFSLDLRKFSFEMWLQLGECVSKCHHVSRVPLLPDVRDALHMIYLAKGIHATTAIEGNTLSEEQVREVIEGRLELADSRKYLEQEVRNILDVCNEIGRDLAAGQSIEITPQRLCELNGRVLKDVPCDEGVVPGEFRRYRVGVGAYRAPAAGDVPKLVEQFCKWINALGGDADRLDKIALSIIKAIAAHLYIAWIHPFGDGNGRTARLVEFAILLLAGVPSPAAHLLSNHYNATRSEYYRQLDRTSKSGGDVKVFFEYAIQGLYDGLQDVIDFVVAQVRGISWEHYVFEYYRKLPSKASHKRQRNVALTLSRRGEAITREQLERLTAKIYLDARKTKNTFTRDLNQILASGLIVEERGVYKPNLAPILQRLPFNV